MDKAKPRKQPSKYSLAEIEKRMIPPNKRAMEVRLVGGKWQFTPVEIVCENSDYNYLPNLQ